MKKLTAALFTALAAAAVAPVLSTPVANADICAGAHGRHFAAGGCTNCHSRVHGSNHPAGAKLMR